MNLSQNCRNFAQFYFGSIYLFYICCHYVYCEDRELQWNQYRRILSIQLCHYELFISQYARRVPLFALPALPLAKILDKRPCAYLTKYGTRIELARNESFIYKFLPGENGYWQNLIHFFLNR